MPNKEKKTPIDFAIVQNAIQSMHLPDFSRATIREIVTVSHLIEQKTGEKFVHIIRAEEHSLRIQELERVPFQRIVARRDHHPGGKIELGHRECGQGRRRRPRHERDLKPRGGKDLGGFACKHIAVNASVIANND